MICKMNMLSNSWEWQITSKVAVEEWFGDSAEVRRFDLEILVLVEIDKIKLTIFKYTSVKSVYLS